MQCVAIYLEVALLQMFCPRFNKNFFFFDNLDHNGHVSGSVKDPVTDYRWVRNFDSRYWGSSCISATGYGSCFRFL